MSHATAIEIEDAYRPPSTSEDRSVRRTTCPDAALVTRAQKELPYRTSAYEALVRQYFDRTVRLAESIVGSRDEAESIAQDAMLRVHANLASFRGDSKFSTWLYRITENLCRTYLGRERREQTKRQRLMALTDAETVDHVTTTPSGFDQMLSGLAAEERALLAYRFMHELELQQIAEIAGIGTSALKMRYYRLLARLRTNLDDRQPNRDDSDA